MAINVIKSAMQVSSQLKMNMAANYTKNTKNTMDCM